MGIKPQMPLLCKDLRRTVYRNVHQAFDTTDDIPRKATAEDLIRFTKPLTMATAKAVAAGNSCRQEDIIAASNLGRKCIFELFAVIKVRHRNELNGIRMKSQRKRG